MKHRIEFTPSRIFIGLQIQTSIIRNRTAELWGGFMPRRTEIKNSINTNLFSLQVYPSNYFNPFNPSVAFTKWALIEVNDPSAIPEGMGTFNLPEGEYVVFNYQGSAAGAAAAFQWIFTQWFPASDYTLDDRPHFELLGEKYKRNSEDSEEEIWIPVKKK
jgi:AraC family transcriptional regulator